MTVSDEASWFNANRAFIATQYNGQWVLVKDKKIQGSYPDYSGAFQAGVQMFGPNSGFLVEQALPEPPVYQVRA